VARPLWLIDLDNTLYDASWRVMGEINRRMTAFMADRLGLSEQQASHLRERYWKRYGATLLGLIRHHEINPHEFLSQTHPHHDLHHFVPPARGGRDRVKQLIGERWLLTNASRHYALKLLQLLGLQRCFDRVIAIEDMKILGRLRPKPSMLLMRRLLRQAGRPAGRIRLVDDHDKNLQAAHRLGMRTARVLVSKTVRMQARDSGRPLAARRPSYVRLQVHCLRSLIRAQHFR
jgi:putative hydrolase of the HAD superfamily